VSTASERSRRRKLSDATIRLWHTAASELILEWGYERWGPNGRNPRPEGGGGWVLGEWVASYQLGGLGSSVSCPAPRPPKVFLVFCAIRLPFPACTCCIQSAWLGIRCVRTDVWVIWVIITTSVKLDFKKVDEYSYWSESPELLLHVIICYFPTFWGTYISVSFT